MNAIEMRDVAKTFPPHVRALRGLDLAVPTGSVYGLLGRNGSGKTTALRTAMGLLHPDSGSATVLGAHMSTADASTRARVAYVPQKSQAPGNMTLAQLCRYTSHMYPAWSNTEALEIARRFDVPMDRPFNQLSGGQQRKAHMVLAFAGRAEVIVLDEPAAGLDPAARRQFIDEIVELVSEEDPRTVLLSTHILSDLERLADRVGFMQDGVMARELSLEDLQRRFRKVQVIFTSGIPPPGFRIPCAIHQQQEGPVVTALADIEDESLLDALRSDPVIRLTEFSVPLEDLFIELTSTEESKEKNNE